MDRFLAMASSTAFSCLSSSSRLDTDFFAATPLFTGDVAPLFLPDSLSLSDSFLPATAVETAAANPAVDLAFNLGLAAALNSLAWRPRRAASDELPDEEDDRDSLSDSLDDDDESEPEDEDLEYRFLLRPVGFVRPYGSTSSLCLGGAGGLAACWRAAAGEGARRRGAGGFMAVARAVARRRSRTITDGDNLCLEDDEALLFRLAPGDRELRELVEEYESSELGGRLLLAAGEPRIQGSAHSSPRPSRPSPRTPGMPRSRPSRRSTSARWTITSRDGRMRRL